LHGVALDFGANSLEILFALPGRIWASSQHNYCAELTSNHPTIPILFSRSKSSLAKNYLSRWHSLQAGAIFGHPCKDNSKNGSLSFRRKRACIYVSIDKSITDHLHFLSVEIAQLE